MAQINTILYDVPVPPTISICCAITVIPALYPITSLVNNFDKTEMVFNNAFQQCPVPLLTKCLSLCFQVWAFVYLHFNNSRMSQLAKGLVKEFKHYNELVDLLKSRNMTIGDEPRTERKLAQVGYYRISGYWYPCREASVEADGSQTICNITGKPKRLDKFNDGTSFEKVYELYLFDKKLRLLILDALERIEVHIRSIIAHEVGRGDRQSGTGDFVPDPLAWKNIRYIDPKFCRTNNGAPSAWDLWMTSHQKLIARSKDDSIEWHVLSKKEMPFWVVIEAWDFGTLSKYYGMLKETYKRRVCSRLGLQNRDTKLLGQWIRSMNILRNRCAHHSRIWNQRENNQLNLPNLEYFNQINLTTYSKRRLFALIAVMWFLVKQIGPSSRWMQEMTSLLSTFPTLPNCSLQTMGVPSSGIPNLL